MSAKARTAMVCGKLCTAPDGDYYVTCSFDPNHVILRSRMPYHIINCVKQHPGHNKKQCPYDSTEYIDEDKFVSHLLTCEFRRSMCSEKYETADLRSKGQICNIKQTPFFHDSAPKIEEEWGKEPADGDKEFSPGQLQGMGRGMMLKKKVGKKGMGRAELLNHILKNYQEQKPTVNGHIVNSSDKQNRLRENVTNGQFDN